MFYANFEPIPEADKYLLVIGGPTAVGKTAMAIELALHFGTEIISADSRQFYRQMDIGTSKPSVAELARVKHHFIDCKEVSELYGAGHFARDAEKKLKELFGEHNIVIAVGGSGLYLEALMNGVDEFAEVPITVREGLNHLLKEKGKEHIAELLKEKDPRYYAEVDRSNPQRMIRALEICLHSGKAYSDFLDQKNEKRNFIPIPIFLNCGREELYERINRRVDEMMKNGLMEEVKGMLPYRGLNALKTVGYRELFDHLDGKCTLEEAVDKIKQHTRNYAKRQLTWFRNKGEYEEFGNMDKDKIITYVEMIIAHGRI